MIKCLGSDCGWDIEFGWLGKRKGGVPERIER
jgi:hypothetical protein